MERSAPRSERVDVGHATLALHHWGHHGPVVLLAHPTGFHGRIWTPVAEGLVRAGLQVAALDFRGHGDSDAPSPEGFDYAWSCFADDVLAVVDHLAAGNGPGLVAAGHSQGATALLLATARRPGTFRRLWCYEPIVFAAAAPLPPDPTFPLAVGARRRRYRWAGPDEAFAAFRSKPPLSVMTDESLRAYVDHGLRDRGDGTWVLKCHPEVEAQVYTMGPANGAFAELGAVDAAVLVTAGQESDAIPPRFAARVVGALPHAEAETWAGHGHFGPQADPERAVRSMLAWFGPAPAGDGA